MKKILEIAQYIENVRATLLQLNNNYKVKVFLYICDSIHQKKYFQV